MKTFAALAARMGMAAGFACVLTSAATTQTWEMNTYQDFLRGRLRGAGVSSDGRLIASPALSSMASLTTPQIWSVAQTSNALVAGGSQGEVWEITPSGVRVVVRLPEPQVFAVAVSPRGEIYAATSPNGKIYRIVAGKAEEYFAPGATYIWTLAFAPDGSLFAGTGSEGKIHRVTAKGQGEVWYETGQANVTSLAMDRQGNLLAGSEPNGILYRVTAKGKAFVLYDANLPEIRAIVPAADGTVYVAALGGSVARRAAAAGTANTGSGAVTAAPISITVTDQNAQVGPDIKPKVEAPKTGAATTAATSTGTVEVAGVEKSAIYRILTDNTVETLWSSKDENAYDVAIEDQGSLLFVTDGAGRLYRLEQNRKNNLLAESGDGELTRLLRAGRDWIAAGAGGTMYRLGSAPVAGSYESPVHDSGAVAKWGKIRVIGSGWRIETRSGNSTKPDPTWSDWAAIDAAGQIANPNARFIQWRAELSTTGEIDSVSLAYLPQNTPPVIRSISVTSTAAPAPKTAGQAKQSDSFTVTVTETGESSSPAGTPSQTIGRAAGQQLQLAWQAEDPDGDKLIYSVYFRGLGNPGQEPEREWKLLKASLTDNTLAIDGDSLADGRYLFRVVASDQPSNAASAAREAELIGAPVVIDSTPPVVTAQWTQGRLVVSAKDATSTLRRCEYSIDAGPWIPVEAEDGVTDSPEERFVASPRAGPGEHLIVVRVYDAAGNAGLTRIVVR